jgi:hypothetical protein
MYIGSLFNSDKIKDTYYKLMPLSLFIRFSNVLGLVIEYVVFF